MSQRNLHRTSQALLSWNESSNTPTSMSPKAKKLAKEKFTEKVNNNPEITTRPGTPSQAKIEQDQMATSNRRAIRNSDSMQQILTRPVESATSGRDREVVRLAKKSTSTDISDQTKSVQFKDLEPMTETQTSSLEQNRPKSPKKFYQNNRSQLREQERGDPITGRTRKDVVNRRVVIADIPSKSTYRNQMRGSDMANALGGGDF